MPYALPCMRTFRHFHEHLPSKYENLRRSLDSNRLLGLGGFFLSPTHNPLREVQIQFLLAVYRQSESLRQTDATKKKGDLPLIKELGLEGDYEAVIAPFLRRIRAGACQLVLQSISDTYTPLLHGTPKAGSALAALITKAFHIESIAEIPADEKRENYDALTKFLTVMQPRLAPDYRWYATRSNEELLTVLAQAQRGECLKEEPIKEAPANISAEARHVIVSGGASASMARR